MMQYGSNEKSMMRVRELIGMGEKRAYVMTFGCQQNEADSERIRGMAAAMGYSISDSYEDADLIVVNTCAIREHAEMKVLSMLGNFKAEKSKNPDLIIGIVGCMAAEPHVVELLKTRFHYVTFTIEPNMLHLLPEALLLKLERGKRSFIIGKDEGKITEGLPCRRTSRHKAWVSIMYGCNNFCSYCIVPYTRGRERSRESAVILDECRSLVADGVKEITLLGQNVNSYKSDIDFATLVETIAKIEGDFIIRFMTSHPKDVSDRLIEVMATYTDKVAPYFHLPLQSGSDKILAAMNRTYTRSHFLKIARALRERVPGIALSTDVIVGFPGECERDFEDTMDVLREVEFDLVYAFKFSPRKGTPAESMSEQVSAEIVDSRMARLLSMQDEISLKRNLPYQDADVRVLVDSRSKRGESNTYTARTASNKLVHFTSDEDCVGEFVNVTVEHVGAFELIGKIKK